MKTQPKPTVTSKSAEIIGTRTIGHNNRSMEALHVKEFQSMMRRIYFHRDSERGAKGTYNWLVEEVGELGEAMQNEDGKALRDEFADVLAWLASLANVVNVDLEAAALGKYFDKCPKCLQSPCSC